MRVCLPGLNLVYSGVLGKLTLIPRVPGKSEGEEVRVGSNSWILEKRPCAPYLTPALKDAESVVWEGLSDAKGRIDT